MAFKILWHIDPLLVIECTGNGFGAHVPDLPGCIAAGDTREETKQLIREAVVLHLKTMQDDGDPIPEPTTAVEYVPAVCS